MVLGLLNQPQIFWQLYLIEFLELLTGLGLFKLEHLIYPRVLTEFWHASLLHKLMSYQIWGQIFTLICSLPSNRQLWVVLHGKSSQENIKLILEFHKVVFLVLYFSYAWMTFLMMLSVILLFMVMILLSILKVWSGIWSDLISRTVATSLNTWLNVEMYPA